MMGKHLDVCAGNPQASAELAAIRAQLAACQSDCDTWMAAQAKIDALMLEYCPDEITPEQLDEWARHQKPAPDELTSAIDAVLRK